MSRVGQHLRTLQDRDVLHGKRLRSLTDAELRRENRERLDGLLTTWLKAGPARGHHKNRWFSSYIEDNGQSYAWVVTLTDDETEERYQCARPSYEDALAQCLSMVIVSNAEAP